MDLQTILNSVNPLVSISKTLGISPPPRLNVEGEGNQPPAVPNQSQNQNKTVLDLFHETQQKYPKLPTNILLAIAMDESGGSSNPPASISPAGARGMMQQMPAFMKDYKITDSTDPSQTIPATAKELTYNMKVFGNIKDALAAYNMGRTKLIKYKDKGMELPEETRNYVENISAKLKDLGEGRPPGMSFMQYLTTELIKKEEKK